MLRNPHVFVAFLIMYFYASPAAVAADYRGTISVFIENKGISLNHIQVIDMYVRYGFPRECNIAKETLEHCGKDIQKEFVKKSKEEHKSSCAHAKAVLDQPSCQIENLVFDDWVTPGKRVRLEVFTNNFGYGGVSVRALNNTESWTLKFWLSESDTIGHQ